MVLEGSHAPDTTDEVGEPRQSLARLRRKLIERSGLSDGGEARTEADLIRLSYALADRQLHQAVQADLVDRERLTEAHLRVAWGTIDVVETSERPPHIEPVLRLIARQLDEHPTVEFTGAKPGSPVQWNRFGVEGEVELVPIWASVYWDAGTVSDVPLVLETFERHGEQKVQVFCRPEHHDLAKAYLDDLLVRAMGVDSPYRGRLLKASFSGIGIALDILPPATEVREQLVLPAATWAALDRNVHRMFERREAFESAGLGSNRGVLLAGPPGTGKTAACRVLAHEVAGTVTSVFVEPRVAQALLTQLYEELAGLAPALVFLEDLDLLVGSRHDDSAQRSMLDFLTVLDGLMTQHRGIVTIASTNEPDAVDAAVRRAARFDQVLAFPLPDSDARARILEVYLRSLDHDVDILAIAGRTEGLSGADLRELVRGAWLRAERPTTEDVVGTLADTGDDRNDVPATPRYL
jgi:hypothetical protein